MATTAVCLCLLFLRWRSVRFRGWSERFPALPRARGPAARGLDHGRIRKLRVSSAFFSFAPLRRRSLLGGTSIFAVCVGKRHPTCRSSCERGAPAGPVSSYTGEVLCGVACHRRRPRAWTRGPHVQMGASFAHLVGTMFRRTWPDCRVLSRQELGPDSPQRSMPRLRARSSSSRNWCNGSSIALRSLRSALRPPR